nr:hypothetical protein Iba_chr14cCG8980 [Ipomoea batatas]
MVKGIKSYPSAGLGETLANVLLFPTLPDDGFFFFFDPPTPTALWQWPQLWNSGTASGNWGGDFPGFPGGCYATRGVKKHQTGGHQA